MKEFDEKMFIKGFNAGYLLAKYEPILSLKIVKENYQDNSYFYGLVNSIEFYIQESQLSKINSLRNKEKQVNKDR